MTFDAYDRSLELLHSLVPLLARVASCDAELADQLRRAAQSCVLNVAEANRRTLRDRRSRFRFALGSAAEVSAALEVACALGYVGRADVGAALELADRVRAMTYRLAR